MASLACGDDCAPPSWDTAGIQAGAGFGCWCVLLLGSYGLTAYSFANNPEKLQVAAQLCRRKLHNNFWYVLLHFSLSTAMFGQFCMRTLTHSVSDAGLFLDYVACFVYFIELILGWLDQWFFSLVSGHMFVFTWGIVDCAILPSVLLMIIPINGRATWNSFSFLAAFHMMQSWQWLFRSLRLNLQSVQWQVASLAGEALMILGVSSMAMLEVELLGDPARVSAMGDREWNTVSAFYFVFNSVATVGYGDVTPGTVFGRATAILAIVGGILLMAMAMQGVAAVATEQGSGKGSFRAGVRTKSIVISGNPTAATLKDFISEMFHPDHADDAEDIHLIFLFPSGGPEMEEAIRYLGSKGKEEISIKVSIFQGSVLDINDLDRVSAAKAMAFYVLPNMRCQNPFQEDAENIIRMIALRRYVPSARLILLLLKAESRHILEDSGINSASTDTDLTILAADQFKLELIGKSCEVLGFAPFICNLCQSVGDDAGDSGDSQPSWLKDYMQGVGNELYEIELSTVYADSREAVFAEVVMDVLEQTGGYVYLIGLVEQSVRDGKRTILINPGCQYRVKKTTSGVRTYGIFIAADRDSVIQCEVNMVFLGRRERPANETGPRKAASSGGPRMLALPTAGEQAMTRVAGPVLTQNAKLQTLLSARHYHGRQPGRPPLKTIATGGHILVLCVGTKGERDLRLSAHHFVRPLRQGKDVEAMTPIVFMSPTPPRDWETVCDQPKVYMLRGSPLSQLDLERANFRAASTIFICNVGSQMVGEAPAEQWMVDSEMICCSRLVESQLPIGRRALVVADLRDDQNHLFLPVPATSNVGATMPSQGMSRMMSSQRSMYLSSEGEVERSRPRMSTLLSSASSMHLSEAPPEESASRDEEYFRQPRFASGQLYTSTVITSLVANTFYNPSLCDMLRSMVAAEVRTIPVPSEWAGKSYFEYFDHLLWAEECLAVCILRRADPSKLGAGGADMSVFKGGRGGAASKRRFAFVYTAPPAKETTMLDTDLVICFCKHEAGGKPGAPARDAQR